MVVDIVFGPPHQRRERGLLQHGAFAFPVNRRNLRQFPAALHGLQIDGDLQKGACRRLDPAEGGFGRSGRIPQQDDHKPERIAINHFRVGGEQLGGDIFHGV
ncbi:hypothetical protein D1872_230420 [compost metagenome]